MQIDGIKKVLRIPEYKVTGIEINERDILIKVEPYKCKKAECSLCGQIHKKGYHDKIVTVVKDLDISGDAVYLEVIKRRYKCSQDNKVHIEKVSWLKMYGRVTRR